jgi:flagellar biogenesis protein FliO
MENGPMLEWMSGYLGADSPDWLKYLILGLIALIALLIVLWVVRKVSGGTFISGNRHAQPRLSVQDATPVDSHRRLVLVRRDDVEHLLLIGGVTDIVVEHNIRAGASHTAPARENFERGRLNAPDHVSPQPLRPTQPIAAPRPAMPAPAPAPVPQRPSAPQPIAPRATEPEPSAPRFEPVADPTPVVIPAVRPQEPRFAMPDRTQRLEPQLPGPGAEHTRIAPTPVLPPKSSEQSLDDELEQMLGDFDLTTPYKPN